MNKGWIAKTKHLATTFLVVLHLGLVLARPAAGQLEAPSIARPDAGLVGWTVLTFAIVFGILARYAWPRVMAALEAREKHVHDALAAAEQDRADAAKLLQDARQEREATRAQTSAAIAQARDMGNRLRAEIVDEARREGERILTRARQEQKRVEALRASLPEH